MFTNKMKKFSNLREIECTVSPYLKIHSTYSMDIYSLLYYKFILFASEQVVRLNTL